MIVVDQATLKRLTDLVSHPRSESKSLDAFLRGVAASGADPATFADMLEMQFDASDAALTFAERREAAGEGRNILRILVAISQTFGYVVGRVSANHPSPGKDVAVAVYETCANEFARALADNIAWIEPPAPTKQPNTDAPSSLN